VIPPAEAMPAAEACAWLVDELLGNFPFESVRDRTHAVAYLLTLCGRDVIDGPVPLGFIHKPVPGTGAGLLVDALAFPALGRPAGRMPRPRSSEEQRKRLTARLVGRPSLLLFDNVSGELGGDALS
jgi:hypothetical protein